MSARGLDPFINRLPSSTNQNCKLPIVVTDADITDPDCDVMTDMTF